MSNMNGDQHESWKKKNQIFSEMGLGLIQTVLLTSNAWNVFNFEQIVDEFGILFTWKVSKSWEF